MRQDGEATEMCIDKGGQSMKNLGNGVSGTQGAKVATSFSRSAIRDFSHQFTVSRESREA